MNVFDLSVNVEKYETWFKEHSAVFESEIKLLTDVLPSGKGVEIGIGTGLFSEKLGINIGIDPSLAMLDIAKSRKLNTINAIGESLPFSSNSFDYVLMVTSICFLNDVVATLQEIKRILKKNGIIVVGLVDKDSQIGKSYIKRKQESDFYKDATFYSVRDVTNFLEKNSFEVKMIAQTLWGSLNEINRVQEWTLGSGDAGFVVIKGNSSIL